MKHRLGSAAVVAALLLTVLPGVASADGDENSDRAYDLVRQAIALIVNSPDDMEMIVDKITDATEAKDPAGVDIGLVRLAKDAMGRSEQHKERPILLHQVRALLERSIGARVHTGTSDPVAIGHPAPATGVETGTVAAIDPLPGRGRLGGGDWVMLTLSVLVGLTGAAVSLRLRPRGLPHPGPGPTG